MYNHLLIYTFSTFPLKNQLQSDFPKTFIFHQFKKDLELFKQMVLTNPPNLIIGLAKSKNQYSWIETKTVNKFTQKKVSINNPTQQYDLTKIILPKEFRLNYHYSTSFCNWTMFKISEFIQQNNLPSKLNFVHLQSQHYSLLKKSLNYLFPDTITSLSVLK